MAVSLPALAGCVQATRHSNTMVFGTNTSLAARIGQSVAQVPEVSVGYSRQEAVIMPLLANTGDRGGRNGVLSPCSALVAPTPTPTPTPPPTELPKTIEEPHPCKFVAMKTSSGDVSFQDSYSVLASFGANIKARSPGDGTKNAEIGVGIAQYFATGVAAQLLAANGGAAVVSVSNGATASANSAESGIATAAVTGAELTPAGFGKRFDEEFRKLKLSVFEAGTDKTERLQIVNSAIGKAELENDKPIAGQLRAQCNLGVQQCIAQIDAFASDFDKLAE
ncbi:MAG: hypothetical protein AAFR32_08855 [Pseudomonadota bacterium]